MRVINYSLSLTKYWLCLPRRNIYPFCLWVNNIFLTFLACGWTGPSRLGLRFLLWFLFRRLLLSDWGLENFLYCLQLSLSFIIIPMPLFMRFHKIVCMRHTGARIRRNSLHVPSNSWEVSIIDAEGLSLIIPCLEVGIFLNRSSLMLRIGGLSMCLLFCLSSNLPHF